MRLLVLAIFVVCVACALVGGEARAHRVSRSVAQRLVPHPAPKTAVPADPKPNPDSNKDPKDDTKPVKKPQYDKFGLAGFKVPNKGIPAGLAEKVQVFMKEARSEKFHKAQVELLKAKKANAVYLGYDIKKAKPLVTISVPKGGKVDVPAGLKSEKYETVVVQEDRKPFKSHILQVGDEVVIQVPTGYSGSSVGACLQRTRSTGTIVNDFIISTWHGHAHVGDTVRQWPSLNRKGRVYATHHDAAQDWDLVFLTHDTCQCSGHASGHTRWADDTAFLIELIVRGILNAVQGNSPNSPVTSSGINVAARHGHIDPSRVFGSGVAGTNPFVDFIEVYYAANPPMGGDSGGPLYDDTTGLIIGFDSNGDEVHTENFTPIWRVMSQIPFGAVPC